MVPRVCLGFLVCAVADRTLHDAVENNDVHSISRMLNASSDDAAQRMLAAVDENDLMPIHLAAYHGHVAATAALVKGGAPLDARCGHASMTAMHWSTGQGHQDVLQLMLDAGANVDALDGGGRTSLHYAASRGNLDALSALVKAGGSLDALSDRNVTALQMAAERGFAEAVRFLAASGASLEAQADERRLAALHAAAAMGHDETVRTLLAAGAALEVLDAQQRTPLHHAAARGRGAVLETLVAAGAALEAKDEAGNTPRRFASRAGHGAVVRALRDAGAEPLWLATRMVKRVRCRQQRWWMREEVRRSVLGCTFEP
eukprot:432023-Prymnesium_polylepis.1